MGKRFGAEGGVGKNRKLTGIADKDILKQRRILKDVQEKHDFSVWRGK